jgi:hypothetical protein
MDVKKIIVRSEHVECDVMILHSTWLIGAQLQYTAPSFLLGTARAFVGYPIVSVSY